VLATRSAMMVDRNGALAAAPVHDLVVQPDPLSPRRPHLQPP
jgi:hypothetical protein